MGVFMGKKKSLVLYSDSRCPVCSEAKIYLRKQGISFEEINMDNYPELSNIPVAPVICQMGKKGKKGKCMVGFNKDELDKFIKKVKR